MSKKWFAAAVAALVLAVAVTGASFAQTETPGAQATPDATAPAAPAAQDVPSLGRGLRGDLFGWAGKQDWTEFDTLAEGLKLTPTQLFEALHSGKSLSDIATEQGVDLTALQEQAQAARKQAQIDAINAAVSAGTMTQEQADWLLQGIENGWNGGMMGGRGGHGRGMGMMGVPSDSQAPGQAPGQAPSTAPAPTPNA